MIKIAVLGHSPDSFPDVKSVVYAIDNAIYLIAQQNAHERDFVFLLNGNPGIAQWFINVLVEKELPYEVFLTSPPENTSLYWSDEQRNKFVAQLNKAKAIHVFGADNAYESCIKRDRVLIDASQWVLCFWNKKHQGLTYFAMEHAINNNKIVYNGIDGFNLINGSEFRVNKDERLQEYK